MQIGSVSPIIFHTRAIVDTLLMVGSTQTDARDGLGQNLLYSIFNSYCLVVLLLSFLGLAGITAALCGFKTFLLDMALPDVLLHCMGSKSYQVLSVKILKNEVSCQQIKN